MKGKPTSLAWLLLPAAIGLVAAASRLDAQAAVDARTDDAVVVSHTPESLPTEVVKDDDPKTLELCDCEPAVGSPHGLSCEKEGWFISNFEQAGQWLNGGGLVPLSKAICCRPCIPKELPGGTANTSALAVVSMGCHPSSNIGSASLKCEAAGGSFIAGWSAAVRVPNSGQYYYPVGAVDCCTPSLLLSNGEARELERCDCVQENDINCGGQSSNRLLAGYMRWGVFITEFVPIAPALCCKSCISDRVIPTDSCFDLNYCSGHGVCNLGACECAQGFGGADCSHRVDMDNGGLPQWLISIIILCSCVAFCVFVFVIGKIIHFFTLQHGAGGDATSEEGEQLREPLIIGLASDDEGSVGSEDTTDNEEDDDASMPPPISRRRQEEQEQAVGGGMLVADQPPRASPFEISQENAEGQQEPLQHEEQLEEEASDATQAQADDAIIQDIRRAEAVQAEREVASGSAEREGGLGLAAAADDLKDAVDPAVCKKERSGLPGIECSVCLNRPVQVAVVPCGHMCMCRRCSRRLQTCPVCRTRIIRRQRIFVGG